MNTTEWLRFFVDVTLVGCMVYMSILFALMLTMLLISTFQHLYYNRQREVEDYGGLAKSPYSLPVSIVASAYNEETMVLASVRSLLAQEYPEFEVILVNDGSTDRTLEILKLEYELWSDATFYRDIIPSRMVGSVFYSSAKEKRLIVISKENGGNKADAMNCGVNFARYPYICSVDGDTVYHSDALLRTMVPVNHAPEEVIGVTSFFGISREPEALDRDGDGSRMVDRHLLSNFQHMDLMRSFIAFRLAWARLGCMMCNPGGFAIWRRDVFLELGGFSNEFSCEDIEMTFRMHEKFRREKRPYQIASLPELIAHTEGPDRASGLVRQRARWQKVVLEVVWHYRRMLLRPSYGTVGMIALPYFVLFEALAPMMQALSLLSLAAAIALGLLDWPVYLSMLGIIAFSSAIPSSVAVALHDGGYRDYRLRDFVRMLLLGPIDLMLYRPLIIFAGLLGTWQFLKGDRGWDKFERNVRQGVSGTQAAQQSSP